MQTTNQVTTMNKRITTLIALAGAASLAQATLLLNEPFNYGDGALVQVAPAVWFTHSGTANQVDVAGGMVNLTQAESEDVSTSITNVLGSAVSNGLLYASFKVNFSALPAGNGGYFWHFRDTGTMNFRARVFATTAGAASGSFRFGIAAGGNTPVVIPTDCNLGTEYKLVVRYDVTAATATLWINPPAESTAVNRADSTDTTTSVPVFWVCLRQSLSSGNGMGTLTLDDLLVGTEFADVQTIGGPPSISGPGDQHIPANTSAGPLAIQVDDVETPPENLIVTATSDNPALVPNTPSNLALGGAGKARTLTVTPAAGQQGLATIQLVVTDGSNDTATTSFKVYVGEPTISAIAGQLAPTNTVIGPLAFTVNDAETPGSLTVTAASSNEGLVPTANIQVLGSGTNRTVRITPGADVSGTATITLTVSDGTWDIPTSFRVTFYPKFGLVLGDTFDYQDGSVVANSGGFWVAHSGATGETQVVNGRLNLVSGQTEDISANFTNFYQAVGNGIVLYSAFKLNLATLPEGNNGNYFAHYRDNGTANFRARVFAATNGAAPGKFRLGIANGGFTQAVVPRDLSTNTPYLVLVRYNVDTAESTLWVNPTDEASGGATASDAATPVTLYFFCFRQAGGPNTPTLTVDDVKIGTQWSDVWEAMAPEPERLDIVRAGQNVVLRWANPAFGLQAAPVVAGPYTNVPGALNTGYTNPADGQLFFRLKY